MPGGRFFPFSEPAFSWTCWIVYCRPYQCAVLLGIIQLTLCGNVKTRAFSVARTAKSCYGMYCKVLLVRDVLWIACSPQICELRSGWFSSQWRWCSPHSWRKSRSTLCWERHTEWPAVFVMFRQNHDTLGQHRPVHRLVSHDHFVAPHDYHDLQVAQQPSLVSLRSVVCILECKGLKSTAMATMLAVLEAACNSDSFFETSDMRWC